MEAVSSFDIPPYGSRTAPKEIKKSLVFSINVHELQPKSSMPLHLVAELGELGVLGGRSLGLGTELESGLL